VSHRPVIDEPPRHRGKHPAAAVPVIGRHSRMGPDHLLVLAIDLADIAVVNLLANVDGGDAVLDHVNQACGDVTALTFRLEDHAAAMRRTGIGAEHAEEIRKVRHGEAEISGRIVASPDLAEILAVAPRDIKTCRHLRDLEAGRDDDDIRGPQLAVGRYDAIPTGMINGIGAKVRSSEDSQPPFAGSR
jgi:hypothetical protein